MSLLMDALKKAELAKRKTQADNASSTTRAEPSTTPALDSQSDGEASETLTLELQPHSPAPHSSALAHAPEKNVHAGAATIPPLPSLSDHLELLHDGLTHKPVADHGHHPRTEAITTSTKDETFSLQDLDAPASRPKVMAAGGGTTSTASERETIQNLFETKQAPASRKNFALAVGGATLLAVAAISLYFWNELRPKSGLQASAAPQINRPSTPITPATPPTAAPAPAIAGLTLPAAPARDEETEPDGEAAPARPASQATAQPPAPPARKLFQPGGTALPRLDPALDRAYNALNRGDTTAAKAAYEQALGNDPRNIDALSGLAVLAQQAGHPEQAADYALRILETDPRNAFALASLIDMQGRMNPAEAETRLKQALSSQPDSAALNFSLGNLHAAAKRWNDAQQAYFKAMTADPGNPDYLFNLAISLDQLRQPRLAANYYAQAIAAAENRHGGFDKALASERLRQLQQ